MELHSSDFHEMLLGQNDDLIVDLLYFNLFQLNSICKCFLQDSTTHFQHLCYCVAVPEHHRELANGLNGDEIIENPSFEIAIVIPQEGQLHGITENELRI